MMHNANTSVDLIAYDFPLHTTGNRTENPAVSTEIALTFSSRFGCAAVLELLLTAMPVHLGHFAFAVMLGCAYVVFSWYWFSLTQVLTQFSPQLFISREFLRENALRL